MNHSRNVRAPASLTCLLTACAIAPAALAQETGKRLELYGFAMLDMGYEAGQTDPDWFDVLRPTKLPSFEDEFGDDGHFFAGVRQSRLGVKGYIPTSSGKEIKTIFEFELFGTGSDAGQTTFRLRHAWGEYGQLGRGPDLDARSWIRTSSRTRSSTGARTAWCFSATCSCASCRCRARTSFTFALERPGASGDPGVLVGSPELAGLTPRFPLPDLSAHFRMNRDWGHVQIAGILRHMEWDDANPVPFDASGDATGWGINLSSNLKFGDDTLRLQLVYGEGIQNYMNDATVDVGATGDADVGEAIPMLGIVAYYDHTWASGWTSSIGYSLLDNDSSAAQAPSAFATGQYASVNLLNHAVDNLMWGGELIWGERENNSDGFTSDDLRLQFSFKYNFGYSWGGQQ